MKQSLKIQRLMLASVLIFCVLFNHQAESPTFVIAVSGIAVWFLSVERTPMAWGLLVFAIIGTTLSKSTIVPGTIQRGFVDRYYIKTLPCLIIWVVLQIDLLKKPSQNAKVDELDIASAKPRQELG